MAELKTLTINDITYEITDDDAVKFTEQSLNEEQKTQARTNIGAASSEEVRQLSEEKVLIENNPDCHAEYFQITDDGIVSLKPEYRGATNKADYVYDVSDMGVGVVGSKNAELPKFLIIPEIIDGKATRSLSLAIFRYNLAVENVTLPSTITEIPARCFDGCVNLKNVYNTDNIKSIGQVAFQNAGISRIRLPNLEQIESTSTFQNCGRMIYADIGEVTTLPARTFNNCIGLHMVKNSGEILSVGERCFNLTPSLKCLDSIHNLTSIETAAFMRSGIDYDWGALTNCTFGSNATPRQYNPTDFWSSCSFTYCKNPLPTFLFQNDVRWKNRKIGTTGITYNDACGLMVIMHAYCGLHNIKLSTVMEFEEIVNSIAPNWMNNYSGVNNMLKSQAENLGLVVDRHAAISDQSIVQLLYDALADGKYAIFGYCEPTVTKHYVLIYGINDRGEFLIADSSTLGRDKGTTYTIPMSKLCTPNAHDNYRLHIISL